MLKASSSTWTTLSSTSGNASSSGLHPGRHQGVRRRHARGPVPGEAAVLDRNGAEQQRPDAQRGLLHERFLARATRRRRMNSETVHQVLRDRIRPVPVPGLVPAGARDMLLQLRRDRSSWWSLQPAVPSIAQNKRLAWRPRRLAVRPDNAHREHGLLQTQGRVLSRDLFEDRRVTGDMP